MPALVVHVAPHIEPGGFHRDRFDAYLDGELIYTGRQVVRPVARLLLGRGYDPETPLTMWAQGASGPSFKPRPIAAWAGEKLVEEDASGFRIRPWSEPPGNAAERWSFGGQDARDGSGRGVA